MPTLQDEAQDVGIRFLADRKHALLADEPGVGKTKQAILAAAQVQARSVVIVCPAVAIEHWKQEWQHWSPSLSITPVVLSYYAAGIERNWNTEQRWDLLIVDESHYAKNPMAKRSRIFARDGLAWHANRIWCLSGTPTPNNASELWIVMRAFGATNLDYPAFVERYCHVDRDGNIRGNRKDTMPELREKIKPFVLRRYVKDVMPDIKLSVETYPVTPSTEWLDLMGAGGLDLSGEKGLARAKVEEAALIERLKKAKSDAAIIEALKGDRTYMAMYRRYLALVKAPNTYNLLKFELQNGLLDKVVVFGYHVIPMQVMADMARRDGFNPEFIYGGTPLPKRDAAIKRFTCKGPKSPRIMFANMVAAGISINLAAAHECVMFETDWTPDKNAQAIFRLRRRPQERPIRARIMTAAGTLDERISAVVARKVADIAALWE